MDRTGKRDRIEAEQNVRITVRRWAPRGGEDPIDADFVLDCREGMTLQRALEEVYRRLDPTLAFRPFNCNKGICMSCLVSVNGRRKQACTTLLRPGDCLRVAPAHSEEVIRDLVALATKKRARE
jgi:succinate dehydrogenase/fumarate reductase-like Fe-S protein